MYAARCSMCGPLCVLVILRYEVPLCHHGSEEDSPDSTAWTALSLLRLIKWLVDAFKSLQAADFNSIECRLEPGSSSASALAFAFAQFQAFLFNVIVHS